MTKRVLAFLMVIAMVFSLVPTVVVAEETAAAEPGYKMILQKSHNQTSDLTVDVYLQANTADQGAVTGYQFDVAVAEGLALEAAKNDVGGLLKASGATVLADPAVTEIAVGDTNKVLVATVELTGEAPADWTTAFDLTDIEVSTADHSYNDVASTATTYNGLVVVEKIPFTACDAHTGTWTEGIATEGTLEAGNYYLTDDVQLTGKLDVAENAKVTVCLNGYDITAADSLQMFYLTKAGATLNVCDCTATGEGENYTAGKLLPKHNQGGALRIEYGNTTSTINFYGGVIDGAVSSKCEASVALVYGGTLNMYGGLVSNFPKVVGQESGNTPNGYGPIILRGTKLGEAAATIQNVTFAGCGSSIIGVGTGGSGDAKDIDDSVTLVVENVTMVDSESTALAIDIDHGSFKSVTIKGDCQLDAPVYLADGETVTLDLGENAYVHIDTETEQDEAGFNEQVKMAQDGALTDGTVVYGNKGVYVTYDATAGQFVFEEGHFHMGKFFKLWDDPKSLPASGNWYLDTDVTVSSYLNVESELNLDLHGHTVTTTGGKIYDVWLGILNLYDCTSTYDEEGNWVSAGTGKLTGFTTDDAGTIMLRTGAIFNMYGGAISGNSGNNGVAVYMYATNNNNDKRNQNGAVFNMYGGEISENTSTVYGAAISTNDFGDIREGKNPAKINIYGGKIYNNTTVSSDAKAQGTIRIAADTEVTMYGGEISGNTADYGGAFSLGTGAKLTVKGGKISGNTANKEGGAIYQANAAVVEISDAEVSGNSAPNGGAFRVMGTGGTFTVTDTKVSGNTATTNGGAAYVNGTPTVTVTGGEWSGNTATTNGGAMRAEGNGAISFTNVDITGNTGTSGGGAFSIAGSHSASFTGCTLTGNVSSGAGAAIYISGSTTLRLDDTVVTGNDQQRTGKVWRVGAVYSTNVANTVTLAGRTVIAGNLYNGAEHVVMNLFFQNKTDRTDIVLVDELEAGAHIEAYNEDGTEREATVVVKTVTGEAPTNWSCGYITYYTKNDQAGKNVSYVNDAFTFGHYHTAADGTTYEMQPWGTTTVDADGVETFTATTDSLPGSGTYYLTKDVTISGPVTIESGSLELCTNGHNITASAATKMYAIKNAASLTIKDCTAGYDQDGHLVTGSKISDVRANGNGGVFVTTGSTDSTLRLSGLEFVRCRDYKRDLSNDGYGGGVIQSRDANSLYVDGCKFTGGWSFSTGGAINIRHGTTWKTREITNCVFEDNIATRSGGAIYVFGKSVTDSAVTIDNCVFDGNSATTSPTSTTDLTAKANSATGGAIYVRAATLNVTNSDFIENQTEHGTDADGNAVNAEGVTVGLGGAIYVHSDATLSVDENCTFTGNSSINLGGALYTYAKTNTAQIKGIYKNNSAVSGGAIYHTGGGITINGATFEGNSATEAGGALVSTNGTWNLTNSEFIKNTAGTTGGAFHNINGYFANLSGNTFDGNTAGTQGGAIYTTKGTWTKVGTDTAATVFKNNVAAGDGGAIYLLAGAWTITNATFENNTGLRGGAIYSDASTITVTATNTDFTGNVATSTQSQAGGGAMYIEFGKITLKACDFDGNKANYGGALVFNGHNATATTNVLTIAESGDEGCNFTNNVAQSQGGAAYIFAYNGLSSTVSITGANFESNTASSGGGALYINAGVKTGLTGGPITTITDSAFTNNTGADGSAISANSYSVTTLNNCTITGNTSNKGFGALFVQNANTSFTMTGLIDITGNTDDGTFGNANVNMWNKDDSQGKVTFLDLDPESTIGVSASNARYNADPVVGNVTFSEDSTATYADVAPCFISDNTNRYITHVVTAEDATNGYAAGDLILTNYVAEDGTTYQTLAEAVAAEGADGTFKLQAGDGIDQAGITLSGDLYLDLNGKNVSKVVTGENTLTLVDSATDDYNVEDGKGYGKVAVYADAEATTAGNVVVPMDDSTSGSLKHYVMATHEDGTVSAHRVYVSITSRILRPISYGAGFKAIFAADQVVAESAKYGMQFTWDEADGWTDVPFDGKLTAGLKDAEGNTTSTPNQKIVAIRNIVSKDDTTHWDATLTGKAYVTYGDVTVEGTKRTLNMSTMAASALAELSADSEVRTQLEAMMEEIGK